MRRLVLGIAVAVTSLMPVVGVADDQEIADFIKSRLQAEQQQGNLQGFNVDMRVEEGTVWFKGHVSNATQEMTILKTAQAAAHLGVLQVVDDIEVATAQTLQAPATDYASRAIPALAPQTSAKQVGYQQGQRRIPAQPASFGGSSTRSFAPAGAAPPAPVSVSLSSAVGNTPLPYATSAPCQGPDCGYSAPVIGGGGYDVGGGGGYGGGGGGYGGGAPVASGYGGQAAGSESPSLPGYAWPSYAAHPNFGNVSYPQQYSPSAWPYIGPFYPYPQVPLGWRKVSLEWDDGFWQLDFHDK